MLDNAISVESRDKDGTLSCETADAMYLSDILAQFAKHEEARGRVSKKELVSPSVSLRENSAHDVIWGNKLSNPSTSHAQQYFF